MDEGTPVSCSECGQAIEGETSSTPTEARNPCPNCQSLARTVHVHRSDLLAYRAREPCR